ncbi:Potassium voltage-gated channel protein [Sarcoptes scabiei]|nr:Potassium voltage-gated channel protein [Sarcoptes scabiei]
MSRLMREKLNRLSCINGKQQRSDHYGSIESNELKAQKNGFDPQNELIHFDRNMINKTQSKSSNRSKSRKFHIKPKKITEKTRLLPDRKESLPRLSESLRNSDSFEEEEENLEDNLNSRRRTKSKSLRQRFFFKPLMRKTKTSNPDESIENRMDEMKKKQKKSILKRTGLFLIRGFRFMSYSAPYMPNRYNNYPNRYANGDWDHDYNRNYPAYDQTWEYGLAFFL